MRLRVGEEFRVTPAADLRGYALHPDRVLAAIDDPADPLLDCAPRDEVHGHVGLIETGMDLDRRAALIAAARSIGLQPPQAEAIAALDAEIEAIEPADPDLSAARRRAAEAADSVEALRERVARLSGRLAEAREAGRDTDSLRESLDEATRQLTEAETEAAAARQALETAEERAAREKRAERLSLVDRRENRRREARDWLACEARERLGRALAGLPVAAGPPDVGSEHSVPTDVVALGIVRLARVRAPVIVRDSPFDQPLRARAALSAPVILM